MITWNGVTSDTLNAVHGWLRRVVPEKRIEINRIEGKDGSTVTELGYDSVVLPVSFTLLPSANIDTFIATMKGTGIFKRSDIANRYWNGRIVSSINIDKLYSTRQCTVEFMFEDPYGYVESESNQTITSFPATISNGGTAESLPLLKITGSGTVNLTLNGITFQYIFPSGETYVYIDCDTMDAYYNATTALRNRSLTITGNVYMKLSVGNNTLALNSGTVSEVVVTKRTRYL